MKRNRHPFEEPYFDPYRIGFALYRPDQPNWRQRTIAGVSWDGRAKEAYFFNPDGLVLPWSHTLGTCRRCSAVMPYGASLPTWKGSACLP